MAGPTPATAVAMTWAGSGVGYIAIGKNFSYTPLIPLSSINGIMDQHAVAEAIVFSTDSSRVPGASCTLTLIADGTNFPLFSGMSQVGGGGYSNISGDRNIIRFWSDANYVYYSVTQLLYPLGIPAYVSGKILGGTAGTLTFSAALDPAFVPAISAFTLSASGGAVTVTSLAISGSTVTFVTSRSVSLVETVSVTYAPGATPLQGYSASLVAGFSGSVAMTNGLSVIRGVSLTNLTEGGNASGWTYTNTTTNGFGAYCGTSVNLQNGVDGQIAIKVGSLSSASNAYMVGVKTTSTPSSYAGYLCGLYNDGAGVVYKKITGGTVAAADNTVGVIAGDLLRLRRSGTTMYAEVSRDNGYTWILVNTWTGVTTAALYGMLCLNNSGAMCPGMYGVGLA
jgi:hypothetical protein